MRGLLADWNSDEEFFSSLQSLRDATGSALLRLFLVQF